MALTRDDLKAIGDLFVRKLKDLSFGNANNFSSNNARRSRATDSKDPGTFIEELDDMLKEGFDKTFKRWHDASRDATRFMKGSALRDAHDYLVESLDDISDKSKDLAKSIAESYADIIKANKGNHQAQQKIHNAMQAYNNKLKQLDKLTSGDEKSQSEEVKDSIKKMRDEVNDAAEELKRLGINADKVKLVWNGHRFKKLDESTKQIIKVNDEILDANEDYVRNLKELHADELRARDNMIKSLAAVSFTAIVDAIGKTVRVADSRLRNLQSSTEWTEAILNGMSPQQMNEWQNSNRLAKTLMGDASEDFYKGTEGVLHQFGYFGNELKQMQTKMANTLINSGIKPSEKAGEEFMNVVGRLQAIEGVSRDEAIQLASDALQSPYYMMQALNKSQDERVSLMTEQLVESRKISKSVGLSNKFLQNQEQEQVNSRYQDIIGKITKSAMSDAYIAEIEQKLGRKLSENDRQLVRGELVGGLSPKQLAEYNQGVGKEIRRLLSDASKTSTEEFMAGKGFSKSTGYISLEVLSEKVGKNRAYEAQAQDEATVTQPTRGEAIRKLDDAGVVDASKQSLSNIEEYTRIIQEVMVGWGANPFGSALTTIGGTIVGFLKYKLIETLFRNVASNGIRGGLAKTVSDSARAAVSGVRGAGNVLSKTASYGARAATSGMRGAGNVVNAVRGGISSARGLGVAGLASKLATPLKILGKAAPILGGGMGIYDMYQNGANIKNVGDTLASGAALFGGPVGQAAGVGWGVGRLLDEQVLDRFDATRNAKEYTADFANKIMNVFGVGTGTTMDELQAKNSAEDSKNQLLQQIIQNKKAAEMSGASTTQYSEALRAFSAGDYDKASKLGTLSKSVASGQVLDENGNPINADQSVWSKILEALTGIEQNTGNTAGEVAKGNEQYKDTESRKLSESKYSSQVKNNVQSLLQARTAGMKGAADSAISAGYAAIDSTMGIA